MYSIFIKNCLTKQKIKITIQKRLKTTALSDKYFYCIYVPTIKCLFKIFSAEKAKLALCVLDSLNHTLVPFL